MMAAMGELTISETGNDNSKQIEQENYQAQAEISKLTEEKSTAFHQKQKLEQELTKPTTTPMTPQGNEDFKGRSENPTQLSKQKEDSTTEAGSVDETSSTSQQLQNLNGNNSRSNVDCEYTFPVTDSITVLQNTEHGICQSQQEVPHNEASVEDKPSSSDPVEIGHDSTEEMSQFPFEGEKNIKSQMMEETRTNPTQQTVFDNKKSQEMLHSQTTENSGVSSQDDVHHEDQEKKKGVNPGADTSTRAGHDSTKREPQFPVKGHHETLESQMMDEAETKQTEKAMFNNNIRETLCSQTRENSDVTGLDAVHHKDQEVKKVVNSEADTSIQADHNAREEKPQFPVEVEKISESQMTDEAKTNQSEKAKFNNKSIQQISSSETTENSHVWENIQVFGEFRLQRRVSTIPTNIHVSSHTQTKEESNLQQRFKTDTEQSISNEQHAIFLAGTLTSQDTNKIIKAAENPDSEELPTVTFGKIYFVICTNLGISKIMTSQDDKDFEASENSSQLCNKRFTDENTSVVNSTITTTRLLPNPDDTTDQNILACRNNITIARGHAAIEKKDVRICQSQQGQQSEQILKCMSQIQTAHQIKSSDMLSQVSYLEAAAGELTSGHDTLQTPTADEAQPQKMGKQMAGIKASISYQNDVTSLGNLHGLDQETERGVNSETETTNHEAIHVSESKTIHHSESTSNIHLIVKKSEECVDDKSSNYDPVIAGNISTEREPQFLIKEEIVRKSHKIVVNSETDTLTDHTTIQVSESKTTRHSESTSNVHLKIKQNEECLDEQTTIYDPEIAGLISTERESQFLVKEEAALKSEEMKKEKMCQGETTMLNTESSIQRSCYQITENFDVWENIQLFGEFRLQRRKTTNITNINGSCHAQHKDEPHLPQQLKPSEESISDKKCAVFLAGTLTSHDFNKIIKAAENTNTEESPTVTFSKIYFITSTDLEMLQNMTPSNDVCLEGLPKNSIHLDTQIDNSITEDTSVVDKTTTKTRSTVAISNTELTDEKSIYKANMSHAIALSDAIKVTGILTMNENPKDHNAEGQGIEVSKDNSNSDVRTEVTRRTDQVEFKATESATTEIVNTGYDIYQTLEQTQTEHLQQASGSPTVEYIESSEMATENLSEAAAAHALTSRHQEQKLGKSEDLEIASKMKATTIVTADSISHETDSMRFTVQHPDVQLSNEGLTSKTDKHTDPKTDKATKSANHIHFQEGKSKCLYIQQNEASSDDKASSKDTIVITQIPIAKDLQFPVKENNILAAQDIKEETNQARGMKYNEITESSEIWETLQGFGEFRLQRKVTKHYTSHTGKKEKSQLEKSETPIRSQDMSHTQHAVFLAGFLDVNEHDKIFKAVANPHAEVLPPVTFKKIVFILPTEIEVVQRMT